MARDQLVKIGRPATVIIIGILWSSIVDAQLAAPVPVADVHWPSGVPARRARACIEAINTDTEEALREFVAQNYAATVPADQSIDDRLAKLQTVHRQLGKLVVGGVKTDDGYGVTVVARAEAIGIWMSFRFEFERDPPHYLVGFRGEPSGPPEQVEREYRHWKSLKDLLEQARVDAGTPAVAAAVVRGGRIVDRAVVGVRQLDKPDPVRIGDRFQIGSVTKSFTATMIGKLVEGRVLRWDMTIAEALSDVGIKTDYRMVTLEQLLQHRGGIAPYTDETADHLDHLVPHGASPTEKRAALVRRVLNEEPAAKPGEEMVYSNAGYTVAAHIAERATKRSWEEMIRMFVFEPLRLRSAGFGWPAANAHPDQPRGHFGDPPALRVQAFGEYPPNDFIAPAGEINCSIEDLGRYAAFHLQGLRGTNGALRADTIRRLHTPPADGNKSGEYASGWMIDHTDAGEPVHWHAGSGGTFYTLVSLYPDSDLGIVVATNSGPHCAPIVKKATQAIHRKMANGDNKTVRAKRQRISIDPAIYDRYVGRYWLAPNFLLSVTREGDRIMVQGTGQPKVEIFAESETVFALTTVDARVTFVRNGDGGVDQVILHQDGEETRGTRIK